jgi:hypothetical protein
MVKSVCPACTVCVIMNGAVAVEVIVGSGEGGGEVGELVGGGLMGVGVSSGVDVAGVTAAVAASATAVAS